MQLEDMTITPEQGVFLNPKKTAKRNRARAPHIQEMCDAILSMQPGESFFVEGAVSGDFNSLRKAVIDSGAELVIRNVDEDQVHGTAGVRVWRHFGWYDAGEISTEKAVSTRRTTPDDYDPDLDGEPDDDDL